MRDNRSNNVRNLRTVQAKPIKKNLGTHEPATVGEVLYQLGYQTNWELLILWNTWCTEDHACAMG